ncbi:hypothetical protein Tsubulata_004518 [Turnera subulata]|uniref:SAM domain-containing protein n=1 Tax=Turnera subulata TaxID=218843 RepID=A0A9Q0GJP1_9ROSI|nr:hypothetical protein Tsubulata_004518 [Turnera subulata]
MAAELPPPEGPSTAAAAPPSTAAATSTATSSLPSQPENPGPAHPPPKRQRRPSVRLGEIGDQSSAYDSHVRRPSRQSHHQFWPRLPKEPSAKSVKARSLTNLVNGNAENHEIQDPEVNATQNGDVNVNLEVFGRKKAKRGTTKRVRSNWIPKFDEADNHNSNNNANNSNNSREDGAEAEAEAEAGFRDFDRDSDQSPVHSVDNGTALDSWQGQRRTATGRGGRVSTESREDDGAGLEPELGCSEEGVKAWLIDLGLSRYAPVFEIHEVDDEVLPLLTLEDLKDMGINAVGSRRKLYSAILKLRKGSDLVKMRSFSKYGGKSREIKF